TPSLVYNTCLIARDLAYPPLDGGGKLSPRTIRCVFLGFPVDAPDLQFYHPAMHRVLSSYDDTFDDLVFYYRLYPHRGSPVPPSPLFLVPGPP
ncbi:unnamed protein product, partial [Closterium sp. NIES-53]